MEFRIFKGGNFWLLNYKLAGKWQDPLSFELTVKGFMKLVGTIAQHACPDAFQDDKEVQHADKN